LRSDDDDASRRQFLMDAHELEPALVVGLAMSMLITESF
jgi:hypothetical protein